MEAIYIIKRTHSICKFETFETHIYYSMKLCEEKSEKTAINIHESVQ
jgi:hypothetical protein